MPECDSAIQKRENVRTTPSLPITEATDCYLSNKWNTNSSAGILSSAESNSDRFIETYIRLLSKRRANSETFEVTQSVAFQVIGRADALLDCKKRRFGYACLSRRIPQALRRKQ